MYMFRVCPMINSMIAAENNSTTIFPIPLDLFRPFLEKAAAIANPPAQQSMPAAMLNAGQQSQSPVATPVEEKIPVR